MNKVLRCKLSKDCDDRTDTQTDGRYIFARSFEYNIGTHIPMSQCLSTTGQSFRTQTIKLRWINNITSQFPSPVPESLITQHEGLQRGRAQHGRKVIAKPSMNHHQSTAQASQTLALGINTIWHLPKRSGIQKSTHERTGLL